MIDVQSVKAQMTPYLLPGNGPYPMMVICPGGGYQRHADHEGTIVAQWLNELGISAVVLKYRVAPHQHPAPLQDAQAAIRMIRSKAKEWRIDPNRVGIMGFSAGGHVAASAGIHFQHGDERDHGIHRYSSRPDLMILCYPVITMGTFAHMGSRENLLGNNPDQMLIDHLSLEKQVSNETPPTFIWHTADDQAVPVENSIHFAAALSQYNIPYALHIFSSGRHGLGLAQEHPDVKQWTILCEQWLRQRRFIQ